MKKLNLLFILALLVFTGNLFGQTALPANFSFSGNNPPGTVEYFVEKQTGPTTWVEICKGPQSPIATTLLPGVYVFRVKARWPNITATSGPGVSNPSEELSTPWGTPVPPTTLKIAALILPNGQIIAVRI
jgi:hypothetical protein